MATEKQINANRKNAQKSTGPKTDEGKAAISKNAVKHGLFAQSVIFGENDADYEAFHDQMLPELEPVGAIETVMAERIINLWWRLKRAERMQNEVIEDMIIRKVTNDSSRRSREYDLRRHGLQPDDPEYDLDGLALGRIAAKDFAYCRILDRMLMYERRIENSVIKLTKELRKQQLMRRDEQQLEPSPSLRDEAATREKEKMSDLKKQSQFTLNLMGLTPFVKGTYDDNMPGSEDEKKANFNRIDAVVPKEGFETRAKSISTATG